MMEFVFINYWIFSGLAVVHSWSLPSSGVDERTLKQLCIADDAKSTKIPNTDSACDKSSKGILVEKVMLSKIKYNSKCYDESENYLQVDEPLNMTSAIHLIKRHELRQSCNARPSCLIPARTTRIPINGGGIEEAVISMYQTYVIKYSCWTILDTNSQTPFNKMTENFSRNRKPNEKTTLWIKEATLFSRQCVVKAPEAKITWRLLWYAFEQTNRGCSGNMTLILSNISSVDFNCDRMELISFPNKPVNTTDHLEFEMMGSQGVVWLEISAANNYTISCRPLPVKYSVPCTTKITKPTEKATTESTLVKEKKVYTTTGSGKNNNTSDDESDDSAIAIPTAIAILFIVICVLLIIYIFYIRKNSPYQRRRSTRRLELEQDQEQQQQQQQIDSPTYDEYTYLDATDSSKTGRPIKIGRGMAASPTTTLAAEYSDANYSDTYSNMPPPERSQVGGEYNRFEDKSNYKGNPGGGDLYDTTEGRGEYSHFDDVNANHAIVSGNVYNG